MNIIKLILGAIGLVFVGMLLLWVIGFVSSIFWYVFWFGLLGAIAYGGYRLFKKAEDRALGGGSNAGSINARDFDMSWDEYDKKYLHK
jgi:hypothetical protein